MEIVNAHVHMIELEKMVERQGDLALPAGISVLKEIEATLPLLDPKVLLAQMDEARISRSILYAVEAPIVYASNEYVAGLCEKYPDRLIGFASADPKASDAPAVLERAIRELGLKGVKFHPPLQDFFPDDESIFPVYRKLAELGVPVVFHVGTTPFGSLCRLSQANPLLLDEVAVRFPDLRILLTHLGTLWHNEAFMVVEKNPNVFIDTAAYLYEIPQLLTRDLVDRIGADKIIFGTDYPMPYAGRVHRMKDFTDCVSALDLPEETLRGIFAGNLNRLIYGDDQDRKAIRADDMARKAGARKP